MTDQLFNAQRIWRICLECAETVTPGPKSYSAATLLFGTCAQESALRYERQLLKPDLTDKVIGGFSKWQLERGSVSDSMLALQRNAVLARRATDFLFADQNASTAWVATRKPEDILWAMRMQDNDHLGALFCRLHYLRVPEPIPVEIEGQAKYWKDHYNTALGAGTVEYYMANWAKHCSAIAD